MDSVIERANANLIQNGFAFPSGMKEVCLGGRNFDDFTAAWSEIVKIYLYASWATNPYSLLSIHCCIAGTLNKMRLSGALVQ
jgi:hypothetical protein